MERNFHGPQYIKLQRILVMRETANLVTFAEEIPNGKLHFLCSGLVISRSHFQDVLERIQLLTLRLCSSFSF